MVECHNCHTRKSQGGLLMLVADIFRHFRIRLFGLCLFNLLFNNVKVISWGSFYWWW